MIECCMIQLWIAFNCVSLILWQQPVWRILRSMDSCELLSIAYLWYSDNNKRWTTTMRKTLWIAFNCVSLILWQQRMVLLYHKGESCELLSIAYLWYSDNNADGELAWTSFVVNCFQLRIFDTLTTTFWFLWCNFIKLWIAFNCVSLILWQQR